MIEATYKRGNMVEFIYTDMEGCEMRMTGEVVIVDAYGTFFNPDEPCYDARLNDGRWVKHIPQSAIQKKV